jgi:hypothetical protein
VACQVARATQLIEDNCEHIGAPASPAESIYSVRVLTYSEPTGLKSPFLPPDNGHAVDLFLAAPRADMARSSPMIPWLRQTLDRLVRSGTPAPMRVAVPTPIRVFRLALICALAAGGADCSSSGTPTLSAAPGSVETGAIPQPPTPEHTAYERSIVVPGTPTDIYALVARGALGCWLAANGPLKSTHVFRADVAPPSQGGQAEIVVHERDASMRDQRGARAFQVKLQSEAGRVRVDMIVLRLAPSLAEPMLLDVEAWARGDTSCQARAFGPSQAAAPLPGAKTKASHSSTR